VNDRSGQYRINRDELASIRDEFSFAFKPRAKALTKAPPLEPRSTQHAEYLAAHNALIRNGWTVRAIARHLQISHRYVLDMRNGDRPARTENCDWVARLWDLLRDENSELPSGTWG
jgi:hypothetical protein